MNSLSSFFDDANCQSGISCVKTELQYSCTFSLKPVLHEWINEEFIAKSNLIHLVMV